VLAFLPSKITVATGTTLNWKFTGPEPHTVTFFKPGQAIPAPGSDTSLFKPTPATAPYDGTQFVNSGLLPTSSQAVKFSVTFGKAGTYTYHCAVHANMIGTVTVVAKGAKTDTQKQVNQRAMAEYLADVAEGEAAKKQLVNTPPQKKANPDGTTTWTVEMGTSTAHTAVYAFAPVPVNAKPGDKVVFVNNSAQPHTATFGPASSIPTNTDAPQAINPTGRSPLKLVADTYANSGRLPPNAPPGAVPLAAREFTFVVPAAGTYAYVCILHKSSGMGGEIVVS
jgi:plastocyanin